MNGKWLGICAVLALVAGVVVYKQTSEPAGGTGGLITRYARRMLIENGVAEAISPMQAWRISEPPRPGSGTGIL